MRNLISLMSEQAQRMEDIMNKKEKRRCTATNSLQPTDAYRIPSNSQTTITVQ